MREKSKRQIPAASFDTIVEVRTCHDVTRHRDVGLPGFASKNTASLMTRGVSTCMWSNERLV